MYDKHLLNAEIELIKERIPRGAKILDAGCGEGEGTLAYSLIPDVLVHGADFSETRLAKSAERLNGRDNVTLRKVDFLERHSLDEDYDIVVSQRFLINLPEWKLQQQVLLDLARLLKPSGKMLLLEGSKRGVETLNEWRVACGMKSIEVKWHNLFFDDDALVSFMREHGYNLVEQDGLGTYFLLTRGIRPLLDQQLNWDCEFNRLAAAKRLEDMLDVRTKFSRLKLWVFQR